MTAVLGTVIELLPTYHPSYVLRLREDDARDAAFTAIVEAFRRARELTQ
jgi:uracil-DNA glycosylase